MQSADRLDLATQRSGEEPKDIIGSRRGQPQASVSLLRTA
jgi:hypothetical protein